jgi:hypothetical protein
MLLSYKIIGVFICIGTGETENNVGSQRRSREREKESSGLTE